MLKLGGLQTLKNISLKPNYRYFHIMNTLFNKPFKPTVRVLKEIRCIELRYSQIIKPSYKYPILWLRDNCQCKECFSPTSKSRIIDWTKLDINSFPNRVWVYKF